MCVVWLVPAEQVSRVGLWWYRSCVRRSGGDPDLIEIAISAEIRSPDDTHLRLDVQSELRILRNHVMYQEPSGGGRGLASRLSSLIEDLEAGGKGTDISNTHEATPA